MLQEKTDVINWSGYRRGLSQGVVFWQREIYLEATNSPLAYKDLIGQFRYHHDEYQVWETYVAEIDDMQRKLFDISQIMSTSHEDLLLEDACLNDGCYSALNVGLHMGLMELTALSSNAVKEF